MTAHVGSYVAVLLKMPGHNQRNIMGITVEEFTAKDGPYGRTSKIKNMVFNAMGFSDNNEYVDLYPGKCMTNSAIWFARGRGYDISPHKDDMYLIMNDAVYSERGVLDTINFSFRTHIENTINDRYCFMLLLQPTMDEMRRVAGCKSAKKKDLWFCSDWKE